MLIASTVAQPNSDISTTSPSRRDTRSPKPHSAAAKEERKTLAAELIGEISVLFASTRPDRSLGGVVPDIPPPLSETPIHAPQTRFDIWSYNV